jgi:hypothetical protein
VAPGLSEAEVPLAPEVVNEVIYRTPPAEIIVQAHPLRSSGEFEARCVARVG